MGTRQNSKTSGGTLSVILPAISAFIIVITKFFIVGLLSSLARDLGISVSAAGQLEPCSLSH